MERRKHLKPIDIKGRPILFACLLVLQKYGDKLLEMQWKESFNKPNLFYKEFQGLMVFSDMRGTEIIPIWDEPYPYLYVSGEEDWKKRRSNEKSSWKNWTESEFLIVSLFYEEMEPDGLFFGDESEPCWWQM